MGPYPVRVTWTVPFSGQRRQDTFLEILDAASDLAADYLDALFAVYEGTWEPRQALKRFGGDSFDLSLAEQYAEFVLKLTDPNDQVELDEQFVSVDESLTGEAKAKADRYAAFLSSFVRRRAEKITEDKALTTEQREAAIDAFIDRLQAKE